MRGLQWVSTLAICAAVAGCNTSSSEVSDADRSASFDRIARSVVEDRGVPGIAIAVIRDGKPFKTLTYGVSNVETHTSVTGATPFQLASTTKVFSSTAVLLLVADGKLRLDDPIGKYLQDLPASWRRVTVRQLLSHTSGLPDITRRTGELDLVANDWDAALRIIADKPFQFAPGQGWAYTQTNYALLQRLVEKLSGEPFGDFLQQRLFHPLGMPNTFFPTPQRQCAPNYQRGHDGRIVRRDLTFPEYVHAAGGLCSSLDDLIVWSQALDSGKVLPRKLAEEAWTPTKLANGSIAKVGGPVSYGLGWAIDTTPGRRWVGHSGGNSTAFRHYLDGGITVILLHNGASDPDAIATSVARAMLATSADPQADLWDAVRDGDAAAAEAALDAGADVNALDTRSSRNGRYALNWAAINNRPELIRLLLRHGAKIDARNLTGFTALHHAAESGSLEAAKALLDAGANTSIRAKDGETASDVALRKGNTAVAALIDSRRAKKGPDSA